MQLWLNSVSSMQSRIQHFATILRRCSQCLDWQRTVLSQIDFTIEGIDFNDTDVPVQLLFHHAGLKTCQKTILQIQLKGQCETEITRLGCGKALAACGMHGMTLDSCPILTFDSSQTWFVQCSELLSLGCHFHCALSLAGILHTRMMCM